VVCRCALVVMLCGGCGRIRFDATDTFDGGLDAPPGAWLGSFTYRKEIHVTPGGAATLADFPVGIIETSDPQLVAHARPDGQDLAVTAADGLSRLDSELVGFDASTGGFELWTRVPSLPPPTTRLYLYYGGAATTSTTAVWGPMFAGVWHMSDLMGARDSTSHAHHVQAVSGAAEPGHVAGVAASARAFDGVDDRFDIPDPADGGLDFGTSSFSYSIWTYEVAAQNQFDMAFYKGGASAIHPGYCMMLGTADWEAKIHDGTQFTNVYFGQEPALTSRWLHLVAVVDRASSQILAYTNGALAGQNALGAVGALSNTEPFDLGFGPVGAQPYKGWIDEVRIYHGALGADWIAAEYANLSDAGFVTFGAEETTSGS
jgi:hypothetical protein